jgi:uncharacterized NAD(P)/FAD-binding protein YdhS
MRTLDHFIVGGGLSGTLTAIALLRTAQSPMRIALCEENPHRLFRGRAYSTDNDAHLLNVPAGHMSAFLDEPAHFVDWLALQQEPYGEHDFVPRLLFGRYIESTMRETMNRHPEHAVQFVLGKVSLLAPEEGGIRVQVADQSWRASKVWVATGNFRPMDVSDRAEVIQHPNYIGNPWSGIGIKCIPSHASVLCVGTGLTMVDQLLALRKNGHVGPLMVLSRRGYYPLSHAAAPVYPSDWLDAAGPRLLDIFKAVRAEERRAKEKGVTWHSVVNAMRTKTGSIWQGFTMEDKRQFLRHARPFWEIHRHRLPASSVQVLHHLEEEGKLERFAGRLVHIDGKDNGFRVHFLDRVEKANRVVEPDWIINCTGPQSMGRNLHEPWLESGLAQGLFEIDPLGMGISVGAMGLNRVVIVGPPNKGTAWETTAMREIREQVRDAVQAHS